MQFLNHFGNESMPWPPCGRGTTRSSGTARMNLLGNEQSPYLLQHRDNPVHWMPWGEDAFARARAEDKPVLLSVGYAACHWCHVMAHESFEDAETAALMNAHFISIKVDREERPDVDRLYMDALHALGEQGGWPLTMFLKPDGAPFWGGTYFPEDSRYGRPSFKFVLGEIARIWKSERAKSDANAKALIEALQRRARHRGARASLDPRHACRGRRALLQAVDMTRGGLKGAPKFPQAADLRPAVASSPQDRRALFRRRRHRHSRQHLPGRNLRSSRRRHCPLFGRRPLARAPLREDALRQRPARISAGPGLAARKKMSCFASGSRRPLPGCIARNDHRRRHVRGELRCRFRRGGGALLRVERRARWQTFCPPTSSISFAPCTMFPPRATGRATTS